MNTIRDFAYLIAFQKKRTQKQNNILLHVIVTFGTLAPIHFYYKRYWKIETLQDIAQLHTSGYNGEDLNRINGISGLWRVIKCS